MKTTQQKPTVTAPPAAMPDTPPDHTYCLDMYENNDVSIDSYELTRAEFNTLKQHLAGLRGIIPVPTPAEPATEPTTAPQTKLDPMDVRLSNLSPEQEQEVHAALLSRLQQQLAGMEICRIQSIAWYADMEEADRGCDTPAQDFLTTLVLHDHVRPLTPDAAARLLEEFRENFDSMVEGARIFTARYPEAVKSATAA